MNREYTSSSNDEVEKARNALTLAEQSLQSLCATHASTFVAVETRGSALRSSLRILLDKLEHASPCVKDSRLTLVSNCWPEEEKSLRKSDDLVIIEESKDIEKKDESTSTDEDFQNVTMLAERHRVRRRTLLQHSSLLELLELPSLMDACVRGHLYDDALSIAGFANVLEKRHLGQKHTYTNNGTSAIKSSSSSSNAVVSNVVKEVRDRETDLRTHLLSRLRMDVSMPACLEVVAALRRLNGVELERYSESNSISATNHTGMDVERIHGIMEWKLMVDFLEARDSWLDNHRKLRPTGVNNSHGITTTSICNPTSKQSLQSTSFSEDLLDAIDTYRTRCFEISTQFIAIFHGTIHSSATSDVSLPSTNKPNTNTNHTKHHQQHTSPFSQSLQLLSTWISRRIDIFLNEILHPNRLARITDAATLRDALDSSLFFSTSMSRIGADFSPLLAPVFEPKLVQIITCHWTSATQGLEDTLRICRDALVSSPLYGARNSSLPKYRQGEKDNDDNNNNNHSQSNKNNTDEFLSGYNTPAPPRQLLVHPPLARLINSFLTGLNELRRCLLPSVFPLLRQRYEHFTKTVEEILVTNERVVHTPGFLSRLSSSGSTGRSNNVSNITFKAELGEEARGLREASKEMHEEWELCAYPYMQNALEVAFGTFHAAILVERVIENDDQSQEDSTPDEEEQIEVKDIEGNVDEGIQKVNPENEGESKEEEEEEEEKERKHLDNDLPEKDTGAEVEVEVEVEADTVQG